jgi:hypothetical protein
MFRILGGRQYVSQFNRPARAGPTCRRAPPQVLLLSPASHSNPTRQRALSGAAGNDGDARRLGHAPQALPEGKSLSVRLETC